MSDTEKETHASVVERYYTPKFILGRQILF